MAPNEARFHPGEIGAGLGTSAGAAGTGADVGPVCWEPSMAARVMRTGVGGTGRRGEGLEIGASAAKFNSGEIGTGRGSSAGAACTGAAFGSACLGASTARVMRTGIGGAGKRGEGLEMGANEARFNSGEIGTGLGISAGRVGAGGAFGRSGTFAAWVIRTATFGGVIGATVLVSSRFGRRISTGNFNSGGDPAC